MSITSGISNENRRKAPKEVGLTVHEVPLVQDYENKVDKSVGKMFDLYSRTNSPIKQFGATAVEQATNNQPEAYVQNQQPTDKVSIANTQHGPTMNPLLSPIELAQQNVQKAFENA